MKIDLIKSGAIAGCCLLALVSPVRGDDKDKLEKAKNTEQNIRQAEPPQVSTETKKSAAGLPASDFKPTQKPLVIKEPPSPKVEKSTTTAVSTSTGTAKATDPNKDKK